MDSPPLPNFAPHMACISNDTSSYLNKDLAKNFIWQTVNSCSRVLRSSSRKTELIAFVLGDLEDPCEEFHFFLCPIELRIGRGQSGRTVHATINGQWEARRMSGHGDLSLSYESGYHSWMCQGSKTQSISEVLVTIHASGCVQCF